MWLEVGAEDFCLSEQVQAIFVDYEGQHKMQWFSLAYTDPELSLVPY